MPRFGTFVVGSANTGFDPKATFTKLGAGLMNRNKAIGIGLVITAAFAYYYITYLGVSVVGENLSPESASYTASYLLGSLIGAALLAIPISHIPAARRSPDSRYLILGILFCVSVGFRAYERYVEVDQVGSSMSELRDMMDEYILEGQAQDRDFSEDEYGELAPLLEMISNNNAEAMAFFDAVNQQVEVSQIERVFDPQTYTSQAAIDATLLALATTKTVIEQSEAQHLALFDDIPGRMAELPMTQTLIDDAVRGYSRTVDETRATVADYYDVENRVMDKFIEVTEFLATHPHEVSEEGQWLFGTDQEVDTWNTYVEEVNRLVEQEEAALFRMQERNLEMRNSIPVQ